MSHEATLIYTVPLIREAVFSFWRRSVGVGIVVALLFLTGMLVFLLSQSDRSWLVGALAVTILFGTAFCIAIYFVHYANSLSKFRAMGEPQAKFSASESSFTVTASSGGSTMPWSSVTEVWQFKNVWLLLFSKAQFITLPVSCVSEEFRAFIVQRVSASGGKVRS